ncbi:hypothetical protein BKA65DRAFT_480088 [Rhexocercosporidium sp. MPI-PUGE-AT-0058]|nr:hypothetical protein BKA65DRAFT_480088 [Rhexocercosporidium sp. MPI-PUGE-AT-0058]
MESKKEKYGQTFLATSPTAQYRDSKIQLETTLTGTMNRTNSQFGFAMGLDLSADVLKVIAYHEGYGQRIGGLYAAAAGDEGNLKILLDDMAAELQYNLTNPDLELSILQRAVTQLLLVQVGDVKLHNTVAVVDDLVRSLRIILAHPMSGGDRKVVSFIQGQVDSEKARLDHFVRERKLSILGGLKNLGGEMPVVGGGGGGGGAGSSGQAGAGGQGEKNRGFWKGVGRRIKKSLSSGSGGSGAEMK